MNSFNKTKSLEYIDLNYGLWIAAYSINYDNAKALLEKGADINYVFEKKSILQTFFKSMYFYNKGFTPTYKKFFNLLMSYNPMVNRQNTFLNRMTDLHFAVLSNDIDVISELISRGAKVNAISDKNTYAFDEYKKAFGFNLNPDIVIKLAMCFVN